MSRLVPIVADIDPSDLLKEFSDSRMYDIFVMLGALVLAIAIGSVWAIIYSKKKRKHRSHHHHHSHSSTTSASPTEAEEPEENEKARKRFKKMRRPHRPLNPTLAQTRGLPPVRDPNSAPPFP